MNQYDEYYSAIDEITNHLKIDLIGPTDENEELLDNQPLNFYVMGILWPISSQAQNKSIDIFSNDTDNICIEKTDNILLDENEEIDDEEDSFNDSIKAANEYKPSSMAISAMISNETTSLEFIFSFAKYIHREEQNDKRKTHYYLRTPFSLNSKFNIPSICGTFDCENKEQHIQLGVEIKLHVRKFINDKILITVSASNIMVTTSKIINQNESSLFQCSLNIKTNNCFFPIYDNIISSNEHNEENLNAFLYRDIVNYAYGHGCSVNFNNKQAIVKEITSTFMPIEELFQMTSRQIINHPILKNNYWLNIDKKTGCLSLLEFIKEYELWLNEQKDKVKYIDDRNKISNLIFNNIKICIERLKNGVSILKNNDYAWKSFILMNEAMMLQRISPNLIDENDSVAWYPFQLAYIIQIIPDIVNKNNKYHETVDLLWFPTGGGKTEAYLGVSAFTIFFRRYENPQNCSGVTIIMRYTLRLLTIQQFERAMSLICACEYLRKTKKDIPGKDEISIGMWIGSGMTPNKLIGPESAMEKIQKLHDNPNRGILKGNPIQVTICPWCGKEIGLDGYPSPEYIKEKQEMPIHCTSQKCFFNNKLPVYVIDDEIYEKKPTLIISTIDKFARITWEERAKNLFGNNNLPPELIIQDELHLISGPLGSLSGLYEIAIDELSKNKTTNLGPKYIASTATARNAVYQAKNLYNREIFQFPPNGLSLEDSFFSVIADKNIKPKRTYLGLCENGGTISDLLLRVYANLMFMKELFRSQGRNEEIIDQYYSIISYFNAIKDLGSASTIITDRVKTYINTLFSYKFKRESEEFKLDKFEINLSHNELTSRKTSKEIKDVLERLDHKYTHQNKDCFDYVLASNMLSVGIDINRLGLMTMYNQPKTNSEYIQATSRVGRKNPGLIIVLFNSMRTRDKSHYEQFRYYHRAFYKYVEPVSVTPFSSRAIEKALHCVFIAIVRHKINELSSNDSAAYFYKIMDSNPERVISIKGKILKRILEINSLSKVIAEQWLDNIIEAWDDLSRTYPDTLIYYQYNSEKPCLLRPDEIKDNVPFPLILNSVRNVEKASNIFIKNR
ncbi:hypothetical protein LQZ19_17460 [Treponema primitia]|uniref:helicase-related protein n=1 Tax=Treponema primitia TaxID=88058 RepID=UPI0039804A28